MTRRRSFDRDYYARFYEDDPVHTRTKIAQLAQGVHSFAQWWDLDIASVLDIGAGPGYWRDWYAQNHPDVEYCSTDVSKHACETYGHELRDITSWRPRRRFDLVVCHGVLHYLDPAGASAAIENIAPVMSIRVDGPGAWRISKFSTNTPLPVSPGCLFLSRETASRPILENRCFNQ